MRQYEKSDCLAKAVIGQTLQIGIFDCCELSGEVEPVLVFGNPKTMQSTWVPYGSTIKIDNNQYKIIRGEKSRSCLRYYKSAHDKSPKCLVDESGNLRSMYEFLEQAVTLVDVSKVSLIHKVFNKIY